MIEQIENIIAELSWNEVLDTLRPLSLFLIGVVLYAWFIFKYYRFLAKREIFDLRLGEYGDESRGFRGFMHSLTYVLKYIFIFPLFTFFWFGILSIILAFLSKAGSAETVLLVSVALVGAIRVMAYYDEDLSKDLAKMLPFALLGVFLVDISYFSIDNALETIKQMNQFVETIVYYWLFLVFLEFILKMIHGIYSVVFPKLQETKK